MTSKNATLWKDCMNSRGRKRSARIDTSPRWALACRTSGPSDRNNLPASAQIPAVRADARARRRADTALKVVQSQLPTSQLKDPLSDRVCVAMRNSPVSPQNGRVAPLTPIRRHQRVNSRLLLDGQSSLPFLFTLYRVGIDWIAVLQSDEDDHQRPLTLETENDHRIEQHLAHQLTQGNENCPRVFCSCPVLLQSFPCQRPPLSATRSSDRARIAASKFQQSRLRGHCLRFGRRSVRSRSSDTMYESELSSREDQKWTS